MPAQSKPAAQQAVKVRWDLSYGDMQLVVETLRERRQMLEKHSQLKPEGTGENRRRNAALIRESKAKALQLGKILGEVE